MIWDTLKNIDKSMKEFSQLSQNFPSVSLACWTVGILCLWCCPVLSRSCRSNVENTSFCLLNGKIILISSDKINIFSVPLLKAVGELWGTIIFWLSPSLKTLDNKEQLHNPFCIYYLGVPAASVNSSLVIFVQRLINSSWSSLGALVLLWHEFQFVNNKHAKSGNLYKLGLNLTEIHQMCPCKQ